ncbi:MAG: hypothetical protein ABI613_08305, partial [Gemmatimonadota bacterium]
ADPALHYLRDGMLDLLAAKLTGEGGLRATEPRVVLTEWARKGGSATADLGPDASLEMAERLTAGRLLLGDVVGTPTRLVLNASLLEVPGGRQLARISVEGPPDSLAQLVDQMAAKILTTASGETDQPLSALTSSSLPALRAYLDGKARLRQGDAIQAARHFTRALDIDSTFALAGLGLRIATSWYGDNVLGERGLRAAYRSKNRLSTRDRALLDALAGPHYPAPASTYEQFEARKRYQQLAPDRADAWELYADDIFHYGLILGFADPPKSSLDAFKRSVDLDSTNALAFTHILLLAAQTGDTALEHRILRISSRMPDSVSQSWLVPYRWYRAHLDGDSTTFLSFRDSVTPTRQNMLYRFVDHALYNGTGIQDAWYAVQSLIVKTPRKEDRANFYGTARVIALLQGRPKAAAAYLEQQATQPYDVNAMITSVRDAMMADGDTVSARSAASYLSSLERQPIPADTAARSRLRASIRVMEPWRLSRGDTTRTRFSIDRLHAIEQASGGPTTDSEVEIAMIEAMSAHLLKRPNLKQVVDHLDSLLTVTDYKSAHSGRYALAGIVTALIYETLGDRERAFAAARRRAVWWNQDQAYLATQLREEGRLAALAGHPDIAITAYRHYLSLRPDPEPALLPQAQQIRDELLKLEQTDVKP